MVCRILAFILVFLSFGVSAIPAGASLSNVYIAQTGKGGNTGADCANALGATFFNTADNWGSRASQIGPGTTVHVCGTWTGAANAQLLMFQGDGAFGNVITLLFEPGAVLQAPYFKWGSNGTPGGAIDLNSHSHLLIDGGATCGIVNGVAVLLGSCNGIIRATANGTNLTYQEGSAGIYTAGDPDDIEIRNLVISMYVRDDAHDNGHAADGANVTGIHFAHSGVRNLRIHHNNIQHASRGVMVSFEGKNASDIQLYNNYIADMSWGLAIGGYGASTFATNVKIFNNEITNWDNWVSPSSSFHGNGIFTYHNCADGETCFVGSADSYIYNNYVHGDLNGNFSGASASGFIQVSSASIFTIFNNRLNGSVSAGSFGVGNGVYLLGCATKSPTFCGGGIKIYNNTINFLGANGNCISMATATANFMQNNIMTDGCNGMSDSYRTGYDHIVSDYNVGYLLRGNCWARDSTFPCKTLAQFQAPPFSHDLHSTSGNPLLDATDRLQMGSAAINAGVNLTSLGITELNKDANGVPRPSSGPWDIGAFRFISTANISPSTPTNLIRKQPR